MGMEAGTYPLSASSGIPSILALIFFRCFLTATFMASTKSPGTRWSVSSSLQRREKGRVSSGKANSRSHPKYLCMLFPLFEILCLAHTPQTSLRCCSLLGICLTAAVTFCTTSSPIWKKF